MAEQGLRKGDVIKAIGEWSAKGVSGVWLSSFECAPRVRVVGERRTEGVGVDGEFSDIAHLSPCTPWVLALPHATTHRSAWST